MSFYISPPGGNISLQKLTLFAVARFNFLAKVFDTGGNRVQIFDILKDTENVQDSECLIEGTVKDRLSHFILRLACCLNSDMACFFVKAETLLFDFRFTCMTEEELCKLFKSVDSIRKGTSRNNKISSDTPLYVTQFLKTMSQIKGDNFKWKNVVRQYLNGEEDCFMVPFWTVLHFVATRQAVLKHGIAHVPVCKLRETVTSLFEELLQNGLKQAAVSFYTDDTRIKMLLKSLKVMFYERYKDQYPGCNLRYDLCHTEVDKLAHMFPPCMSHLHRSLRTSHRLKHHSRIQYSLFLKEAGLSVHEALMFWRKEYLQSPSNKDGCSHTWSKDGARYTYNIRHLYGLEGSRINYKGHSCAVLQENYHGPHESGGCPFSHFDSTHLVQMLQAEDITSTGNTEKILKLATEKQYTQACVLYFVNKIKKTEDERGSCQKDQFKISSIGQNDKTVLHNTDRKQQNQGVEAEDSDNVSHKANHHSNSNCCDNNAHDSEKESDLLIVVSESEPCNNAITQTCSTDCSHLNEVRDQHLSSINTISKIACHRSKCSEELSLLDDKNINSETSSDGTQFPYNQNAIKSQGKGVDYQDKSCVLNDIQTGLNILSVENEKGKETRKSVIFQKPVEYFENYKKSLERQ